MDVREKLVELLSEKCMETCKQRKGYVCSVEECKRSKEKCCGFYADHLISNGVTVQEWISVDDRLPEEGEYVLCVLKGFNYGGKIQVCKFVPADKLKDKPYFEHFRNGFPSVTHWMPMPQPPKGETSNA